MSTNYYLYTKPDCECCGRPFERLHIGNSSTGWCFSLHVIPEDGINTLNDWRALWSDPGVHVRDEYGDRIQLDELEKIITQRDWRGKEPGRTRIDGKYCIGHGDGTWDYIIGEFS